MPDEKDKKDRDTADALYQAASLGFLFPVAIAVGFFLGRWLDGTFHTKPWLTIILTACGIAAGFLNLFRAARGSGE